MNYDRILLILAIFIQILTTYLFLERNKLIEFMGGEPKEIIAIAYLNDKIKESILFLNKQNKSCI